MRHTFPLCFVFSHWSSIGRVWGLEPSVVWGCSGWNVCIGAKVQLYWQNHCNPMHCKMCQSEWCKLQNRPVDNICHAYLHKLWSGCLLDELIHCVHVSFRSKYTDMILCNCLLNSCFDDTWLPKTWLYKRYLKACTWHKSTCSVSDTWFK